MRNCGGGEGKIGKLYGLTANKAPVRKGPQEFQTLTSKKEMDSFSLLGMTDSRKKISTGY